MAAEQDVKGRLFDEWPEKYDRWFKTPIGALVKKYENELLLDMLQPRPGEMILDVGCGTGIFTLNILSFGPRVTGVDISHPMLLKAEQKTEDYPFWGVAGDMLSLPFADECFDKVVSMTALEFIFLKDDDPQTAAEIERDRQKRDLDTGAFLAAGWVKP